jgi:endonuclease/exonuclease/phosphatase (EEP) superfamily protein YafD
MQIKITTLLFFYLLALPTWSAFGFDVLPEEQATLVLQESAIESNETEVRLLLWNVYKEGKKTFKRDYSSLLEELDPNILVFQESYIPTETDGSETKTCLVNSDCYFSSAFSYDGFHYGVMTSSQFPLQNAQTLHSDKTEPVLGTPKTSLMVEVNTLDGPILVINTHGINFVSLFAYAIQLKEIVEKAKNWQGPIIWAGDFNSWNPGRMDLLAQATKQLKLKKVEFKKKHLIKGFMGFKLDHTYSRGLNVSEAIVIKTKGSDHNALFLTLTENR